MVIEVRDLNKSFGEIHALKNISFQMKEGELFGFIGADGAGKTTLLRILTTVLTPDSGNATVLGYHSVLDYRKIRPLLGYMPGRFSLYLDLTVLENLQFFATVFGVSIEENYELIAPIYNQLEPFKNRLAGNLSGGMKQKLALSCALIHKPKLLILDEPTTGVDAVSRKEFWEMLQALKKDGISILVSTPYMDEARLCDRIALILDGRILHIDTPAAIVEHFKKPLYGLKADQTNSLLQILIKYEFTETVHLFGESIHYTDKRENLEKEELKNYLASYHLQNIRIEQIQPTIEDSFMQLMEQN